MSGGGARALQTLNVYSNDYRICLAQKFIGEKTNEVPAAQEALRIMDIKGTIITADAMNCQKDTAAVIMDGKEDYALALKGNQPLFYNYTKGIINLREDFMIRFTLCAWA